MSRILFVEDDPVVAKIVLRIVGKAGHDIIHAANGLAAVEHLASDDFDLLITDVEMARLDGRELSAWVRADPRLAALPVLVTTGIVDPERLAELREMERVEVLSKPIKLETLLERIDFHTRG